jgi:D-sedoheptulose 7-phosphate isomerase
MLHALPVAEIAELIPIIREAALNGQTIFVIGNGGNAANAAHFATDLGKGSSDASEQRFKVMSLTDNGPWLTALGNDYSYNEIFTRQLMNFAKPGDVLLTSSVSGSSPNLTSAVKWAKQNGLKTVALVGSKRGALAALCDHSLVVPDAHYGRVEDAQMTIYHLIAYAFMDTVGWQTSAPLSTSPKKSILNQTL